MLRCWLTGRLGTESQHCRNKDKRPRVERCAPSEAGQGNWNMLFPSRTGRGSPKQPAVRPACSLLWNGEAEGLLNATQPLSLLKTKTCFKSGFRNFFFFFLIFHGMKESIMREQRWLNALSAWLPSVGSWFHDGRAWCPFPHSASVLVLFGGCYWIVKVCAEAQLRGCWGCCELLEPTGKANTVWF